MALSGYGPDWPTDRFGPRRDNASVKWHAPALALALALLTGGLQSFAVNRHPGLDGVAQDLIGAAIGFWLGRAGYLPGSRSSPVDSAVPQTITAPHRSIQPVTASPRNNTP